MRIHKNHHLQSMGKLARLILVLVLALPDLSPGETTQAGRQVTLPRAAPIIIMDTVTQTLPFLQNWANTGLITVSDNWSAVPGIVGHRGDLLTATNDVDPRTVLVDGSATPIDVNANMTNSNPYTTGGVTEFEIADPVVALQGSGTADAPFIVMYLETTDLQDINVSYNLRDIDGSTDNAAQQVALHYRVGTSGNFSNVPAAYVADATDGPS